MLFSEKFILLAKILEMQIVHLSAECYPVAKAGGLGDVVGALPKYLNEIEEVESLVVMPYVNNKFTHTHDFELDYQETMPFGAHQLDVKILKNFELGFPLYLVQIEGFLHRTEVYGYEDDPFYFTAYQTAALNWIHQWTHQPDVIHCHDYHTGFVPFMMKYAHQYPKFRNIPSIFTIHNGKYQGQMSWEVVDTFPWFDTWQLPLLEWDHTLNAMASAIKCAWKVTTVSPQYMIELMSDESNSLAPLFRQEEAKCSGILNGIDVAEWNPESDTYLNHHYSSKNAVTGKNKNKAEICDTFGFDQKLPLVSFIGRFVPQKGVDVLSKAIWESIQTTEQEINFLIVGSGDHQMGAGLEQMRKFTKGKFNCYVGYNEALARKIYAGSDFLIMPSRFEPCGLNQFYALRYGTLPIVRAVGGLADTIIDVNDEGGNGIRFIHLSTEDLIHALGRAEDLYKNKKQMTALKKTVMKQDFSWTLSAEKYLKLYKTVTL